MSHSHTPWLQAAIALAGVSQGACASLATRPAPTPADIAWRAESGFCDPETVLPLPDDTLLVSNVCDFRTAGDGYLTLLAADGRVIAERVVDNLDSPLGMAFHNHRIFVIDANRVKGFSWPGFSSVSDRPR